MNITGSEEHSYWCTASQISDGECDCHKAALKQIGTWHVGDGGQPCACGGEHATRRKAPGRHYPARFTRRPRTAAQAAQWRAATGQVFIPTRLHKWGPLTWYWGR